ncbi:hypothetical protein G5I_13688 [Acromyrmex echinatior]|uniref:Uncharacterized protein n=1 Tax=Acromyrmex echinatior TaxID=103372 RepID=F4X5P9_ACREC|nr:hypothetical protein G5I_13688 [Acromyrmex echinatior]
MKAKTKIGIGMKSKKKTTTRKKTMKKRILPTAKRDGAIPFLCVTFPMLGALGSLIGGEASMAKAINDSKAARRQLEELQRHDRAMEQGRGLYLAPHKYGRGLYLSPYKRGQGVAAKKKKRQKDDKNALGYNYQRQLDVLVRLHHELFEVLEEMDFEINRDSDEEDDAGYISASASDLSEHETD